jgi:hypothetical protein
MCADKTWRHRHAEKIARVVASCIFLKYCSTSKRAQNEVFIDARDPPSTDSFFFLHMINVATVRFKSAYVHERSIHPLKARDY